MSLPFESLFSRFALEADAFGYFFLAMISRARCLRTRVLLQFVLSSSSSSLSQSPFVASSLPLLLNSHFLVLLLFFLSSLSPPISQLPTTNPQLQHQPNPNPNPSPSPKPQPQPPRRPTPTTRRRRRSLLRNRNLLQRRRSLRRVRLRLGVSSRRSEKGRSGGGEEGDRWMFCLGVSIYVDVLSCVRWPVS